MSDDIIQPEHQWMSLASTTDMACMRAGVSVPHWFQKFLAVAKYETIQLKLDRANSPKTVLLDISDVQTCQMPADCVDWTRIGEPSGQYVKTIGINPLLSLADRTIDSVNFSHGVSPGWLPNGISANDYGGMPFINYGGRSLFAVGGGLPHEGHFRVKNCTHGKEILLDGNFGCSQIYLEYIALGVSPCGETYLDPYIADYILKKTLEVWEEEWNPKKTESSIKRRKQESAWAFTKISGRTNSIDTDTLRNIVRAAYRLTPHI